ncbi:MAG: aspartate carbamoyltransferase catalytic subunit [Clostridia bacterium]|jgi:aspartate carbamoyltransferase catalytic subunit|nr:aspartate carbamoyltransferase catalytic subunit [Clostridia bacterium]
MNILNLEQFSKQEIHHILDLAEEFKNGKKVDYQGEKVIANLFFEPSTRTHYSFDMAALKLGCKTQNFDTENSSLKKGETLYDTIKTFEMFGVDAVVIRHTKNEYYNELIEKIKIPILNAGDGTGNHPTQSLLDLLTIRQEFGHFEGLKAVIVGDVKHSRVAHTNIKVMERLGMTVYTSGPEEYKEEHNFVNIDEIIDKVDIVMLLRVQHERHINNMQETQEQYHTSYGLNMTRVNKMKERAIIMHPAPFNRNVEIADDVVECKKSRIFKQVQNGVYVRMALIYMSLEEK